MSHPDAYQADRDRMVDEQLVARGVRDPAVLATMRRVPRHLFVPEHLHASAYGDYPLPIGAGQTISQPLIVAVMSAALQITPPAKVLEIGTGSGYQAAVLGAMGYDVYSIEIVSELAQRAENVLRKLNFNTVHVRSGDGYNGWPDEAPFDAIILTAAPEHIPQPLLDQLKPKGTLVAPIGGNVQTLVRLTRTEHGFEREELLDVRFVPMTGKVDTTN